MRYALCLLALPVMVAACSNDDIDAQNDGVVLLDTAGPTGPTGPGSWEVSQDGAYVGTTTIEADGRYDEVYADGSTSSGRIVREGDNRICFEPDDDRVDLCFDEGPVQADGSYDVVDDSGQTATIRPVN